MAPARHRPVMPPAQFFFRLPTALPLNPRSREFFCLTACRGPWHIDEPGYHGSRPWCRRQNKHRHELRLQRRRRRAPEHTTYSLSLVSGGEARRAVDFGATKVGRDTRESHRGGRCGSALLGRGLLRGRRSGLLGGRGLHRDLTNHENTRCQRIRARYTAVICRRHRREKSKDRPLLLAGGR